jgi:AraC family transcriptional regulator
VFTADDDHEAGEALPPRLRAVVQCVAETWATQGMRALSTDELAAAVVLSPGHLFRLFREHYGCSPARVLEQVRLARAAGQLQRSNATLAEVARFTGFANPYHFSRRFSAVYGVAPGAYRRLQPPPDPLQPLRGTGLLPVAHELLGYPG